METERKLLKIPLGFRSKIPRGGIYEYQCPENFAKHNEKPEIDHPTWSTLSLIYQLYHPISTQN